MGPISTTTKIANNSSFVKTFQFSIRKLFFSISISTTLFLLIKRPNPFFKLKLHSFSIQKALRWAPAFLFDKSHPFSPSSAHFHTISSSYQAITLLTVILELFLISFAFSSQITSLSPIQVTLRPSWKWFLISHFTSHLAKLALLFCPNDPTNEAQKKRRFLYIFYWFDPDSWAPFYSSNRFSSSSAAPRGRGFLHIVLVIKLFSG